MHKPGGHSRKTGWIAIIAILLSSLLPSLGHALGADSGVSYVEVCTSQGARWVQAGDDGSERAPASMHLFDHCPCCSLHGPALGLPPAASRVLPASPLANAVPRAFLAAPHPLHAWVSAQPRAPPPFS